MRYNGADKQRTYSMWLSLAVLTVLSVQFGCRHKNASPAQGASPPVIPTSNATGSAYGISLEDVADKGGINHVWKQQPRPMRNLEAFGCGCAFLDFDDDGWMDILLVASPHARLYRNKGNGTFEEVTAAAGLDKITGDWKGVAVGDYDGDGRLDIVLTGYRRLALLRNVDGHKFDDVTTAAGLSPTNKNHWGSSAGFMDLDGSGKLTLVILNYVIFGPKEPQYCEMMPGVKTGCPPITYKPEFAEMWENLGNGKFREITNTSGMKDTHGKALVVAFADVDDDGKIDFYIGNDGLPAELMHNVGGLKFKNLGQQSGASTADTGHSIAAMGADWADYDRDGRLDLAVSAFSDEPYSLLHNAGNMLFEHMEDKTGIAGATLNPLGFGAKWIDVDNDGWPDLMFTNGHVYDKVEQVNPTMTFKQPLMLFHNEPDKYEAKSRQFVDLIPRMSGSVTKKMLGRGMATGDFDNDGKMDVLVVDYEGSPLLLHNQSTGNAHWITFDIRSGGRNRFAYGAKLTSTSGGVTWTSIVSPASSYLSSSDPRVHFGLGDVKVLEKVTVRWPDGKSQTFENVAADHIVRLTEGVMNPIVLH
ncbi:MAG: CRTAC1 family protein [Chthonomonadales bacterium]